MPPISRRRFASSLSAAVGAALAPRGAVAPLVWRTIHGASPPRRPAPVIDLSSNENPYGPSPAALEAMTRTQPVACRYPDAAEERLVEAIAAHHATPPDRVVLGCGSSEVLRLCDAAFLGPGRTVVAAEPTFEAVLHYAKVTRAEAVTAAAHRRLPARPRGDGARLRRAHRPRLRLQPQQPDRHDRPRRRARGLPRARAADARWSSSTRRITTSSRTRPTAAPRRSSSASRTWSSRGPSRRSTGWPGCGSATRSPRAANAEALRAQAAWSNVNVAVAEAALASLADPELRRGSGRS